MARDPLGRNENGYVVHPDRQARSDRSLWPFNWFLMAVQVLFLTHAFFIVAWYLFDFLGYGSPGLLMAVASFIGAVIATGNTWS